jgi:hypothetical protein
MTTAFKLVTAFAPIAIACGCVSMAHVEKPSAKIAETSSVSQQDAYCHSIAQEIFWDGSLQYPAKLLYVEMPGFQSQLISADLEVRYLDKPSAVPWQWESCPIAGGLCGLNGAWVVTNGLSAVSDVADGTPRYSSTLSTPNARPSKSVGRIEVTYQKDASDLGCKSQIYFQTGPGGVGQAHIRIPARTYMVNFILSARPLFDPAQYPWKVCNVGMSEGCSSPGTYTGVGMALDYAADDPFDYSHGFLVRCGNNNSFGIGCRATIYYNYIP